MNLWFDDEVGLPHPQWHVPASHVPNEKACIIDRNCCKELDEKTELHCCPRPRHVKLILDKMRWKSMNAKPTLFSRRA